MMKKILIIDDDSKLQLIFKDKLKKEGFETLEALSGMEGIKLAKEQQPDVIILDILMPGILGTDVLTAIKKDPDIGLTPVIMLTNVEDQGVNSYQKGAVWYYIKANTVLEEIIQKIKEILD